MCVCTQILAATSPRHALAHTHTQTEKLLLYGGAIHEAGEVKARRWVAAEGWGVERGAGGGEQTGWGRTAAGVVDAWEKDHEW